MDWKMTGALAFGVVIGWYVYYVNRYRKGDVQIESKRAGSLSSQPLRHQSILEFSRTTPVLY